MQQQQQVLQQPETRDSVCAGLGVSPKRQTQALRPPHTERQERQRQLSLRGEIINECINMSLIIIKAAIISRIIIFRKSIISKINK